ncbi:MAG: helix-turn-helix transcriptional regulator [Bacteroidaceae bacterium]|nr:helix-turn-helix transcriptional regulator [Bacteroidaceae bacterium]MBR0047697.1 helix-turn-helix transcriptional regulator [Bacteroidaceae bacterium]
MLSVLDNYMLETTDDIALKLAEDFRHRRIEKNLTREQIGERAGISASNIVRFEQKGLISLKNLIAIAVALGYTSEIKNLFETPKYSTMEELMQIRRNTGKKRHTENHDVIAVTAAVHVPKLFSMMKMDIG